MQKQKIIGKVFTLPSGTVMRVTTTTADCVCGVKVGGDDDGAQLTLREDWFLKYAKPIGVAQ